jgi:hypothetical protein
MGKQNTLHTSITCTSTTNKQFRTRTWGEQRVKYTTSNDGIETRCVRRQDRDPTCPTCPPPEPSIPLPVHEVLKAPCPTPRISYGMNGVRRGPLDVQRGQRNLPHLRLLKWTSHHRPEERHMERGVNTLIGGEAVTCNSPRSVSSGL